MAIVSSDGSVVPISTRAQPLPSINYLGQYTLYQTTSTANLSLGVDTTTVPADSTAPQIGTTYFLGDNVGSTQYEVASSGWPVYQGELGAWGNELPTPEVDTQYGPLGGSYDNAQQMSAENFKFTGKERDTETGNDASDSVSDYKVSQFGNADFLHSNYASLTIQTSPEVTQ